MRRSISLLFALTLLAACGGREEAAPAPDTADAALTAAPSEAEVAAVSEAAAPVAAALVQSLGGNLQSAIAADGHVAAMEFCNVEAMPLTAQVTEEQGMEVKRTSWRVRNPSNAPDALEVEALAHFRSRAEAGAAPEPWVQADPAGGWRYYQPLPTGDLCLSCHGAPPDLADGVPAALEQLYPDDEATGFTAGELRGLLRVSVPETAVSGG